MIADIVVFGLDKFSQFFFDNTLLCPLLFVLMFIIRPKFQVLSPVFAVHYGFQEKRGRPAWREMQNNKNRKKLDRFKTEIEAKYKKLGKQSAAAVNKLR